MQSSMLKGPVWSGSSNPEGSYCEVATAPPYLKNKRNLRNHTKTSRFSQHGSVGSPSPSHSNERPASANRTRVCKQIRIPRGMVSTWLVIAIEKCQVKIMEINTFFVLLLFMPKCLWSNLLTSLMSAYPGSLADTWLFLFPSSDDRYLKETLSDVNHHHSGTRRLRRHQQHKKSEKEIVNNCRWNKGLCCCETISFVKSPGQNRNTILSTHFILVKERRGGILKKHCALIHGSQSLMIFHSCGNLWPYVRTYLFSNLGASTGNGVCFCVCLGRR